MTPHFRERTAAHRRGGLVAAATLALSAILAPAHAATAAPATAPITVATSVSAAPVAAGPASGAEVTCSSPGWLGAWQAVSGGAQRFLQERTANPLYFLESYPLALPRKISNESLRMIVTPQTEGSAVRIRLTNKYGITPTTFSDVHLGRQREGADLVPGSNIPLTFGGQSSVTVPAGQDILSDPVTLAVKPFDKLAVSFHVPQRWAPEPSYHWDANTTSYLTPVGAGNHAAEESGSSFSSVTSSVYYVDRVDVYAEAGSSAIVPMGDSFINSITTTPDADMRWSDQLSRRLQLDEAGQKISVVNGAVSFNFAADGLMPFLLGGVVGIGGGSVNERFIRDVAEVPGVRSVMTLIGMNDLAFYVSADRVIEAYKKLVAQAHAHGLTAIGVTLTPTKGAEGVAFTYGTPSTLAEREKVNHFIRTSGLFDDVVDLAAATGDPKDPARWAPGYSSDHVHPNDTGALAAAESIDLGMIVREAGCR